jgi:hypothetical protein
MDPFKETLVVLAVKGSYALQYEYLFEGKALCLITANWHSPCAMPPIEAAAFSAFSYHRSSELGIKHWTTWVWFVVSRINGESQNEALSYRSIGK